MLLLLLLLMGRVLLRNEWRRVMMALHLSNRRSSSLHMIWIPIWAESLTFNRKRHVIAIMWRSMSGRRRRRSIPLLLVLLMVLVE